MILNKEKVLDIIRTKYEDRISEAQALVPVPLSRAEFEDQKFDALLDLTTVMQRYFQKNELPEKELLQSFQKLLNEDFEKYERTRDRAHDEWASIQEKRDSAIATVSAYAETKVGNISLTMAEAKTLGIL